MGSPDFAVPSLKKLITCDKTDVKAVISQPDRKKGRGQKLRSTPVKKEAEKNGITVLTSENVNKELFIDSLKDIDPEAIVVVAFGQKLNKQILELPKYGCINLHASLLPKYRGASPIHRAIINGDKVSGISTMYMDEALDKGDIIYKSKIEIAEDDTVGDLHDKLAEKGADLLVKTLIDLKKGEAPRIEQDDEDASYAPKIDKSLGEINWTLTAEEIYNLVRGVNPWPGAYTYLDDKLLKIWQVSIEDKSKDNNPAGKIISASEKEGFIVQTGKGTIKIEKLQLAGKKRMDSASFLRGYDLEKGLILDD